MTQNVFALLDKYWKDHTKNLTIDGVVQNIRGSTASVFLGGSGQAVEAWFGKGTEIVAGDRVLLVRAERANKWVIVAAFGTEATGHSSLTPPAPVEQISDSIPKGFVLAQVGGTIFTGLTNQTQLISMGIICSKEGIIIAGASVYVSATVTSVNRITLILRIDGSEIGDTGGYFATSSESKQTLTGIIPYRVGAGRHTVSWDIKPNGATVTTETRNAWAVEL